ncbi:hypothetical protein BTUL_0117g00400 [Botrytis tulipae]|uniref:Uncharacterized protein n=1 Tax=Botrytis tulipae TaxID=87230 RepID=A0A4Z1EL56_9HELO|nr:hypothetical protein BTUL_0117g00400 [Botrytis tulipae]
MKLVLNGASVIATLLLAHLASAATLGQRAAETTYRGTCQTGTQVCAYDVDETVGDSCSCDAGQLCQGDGNACFYNDTPGVRFHCPCS